MDFFSVIKKRRSVREFSGRKVAAQVLRRIADTVRYAPSSLDGQPWTVIAITDAGAKAALARLKNKWCPPEKREFDAGFMAAAPVILAVCVDRRSSHDRWIENGVIAATYLLLAARAVGLGGTFMTAFNLKRPAQVLEVGALLGLPASLVPVCLLPIGYPAGKPPSKELRTLKRVLRYANT
jgi:nitroreductase